MAMILLKVDCSVKAGFSLFLFKLSMVIISFLLFSKYSNSSMRYIITEYFLFVKIVFIIFMLCFVADGGRFIFADLF